MNSPNAEYLDRLVNGYSGFIYTISSDYKIEFMNQTLMNHIGRDATGEPCHQVLHGLEKKCRWCVGSRVLAGETVNFEWMSPQDNRWYHYVGTPCMDEKGEIVSQQFVAIDIHRRKLREYRSGFDGRTIRPGVNNLNGCSEIIGQSKIMRQIYSLMTEVASSDASVLICGESGTGKELIANAIHSLGIRKEKAFIPVNCGGIPETLIESEFFGYKKGAFTGAHIDKSGFLEIADKGTLFLDEIGEINLNMQIKLLRAIDGDGFTPLGSNQIIKPDIRIISATNRDLTGLVENGQMRSDFFYRINVVPIRIPPLRERREDIRLLVDHFLNKFCPEESIPYIPPDILISLEQYDWPGNVRELQNVIHRYATLRRLDALMPSDNPAGRNPNQDIGGVPVHGGVFDLSGEVRNYEKKIISQVLQENRWQKSLAASMLGINRKTLYSKIKKYNIAKV